MRGLGFFLGAVALLSASSAEAACVIKSVANLPVTMVGLEPTVEGTVNGETLRFLADSGAFFSSLPAATAAQHKLRTYPAPFGLNVVGVGGRANMDVTKIQTFQLANAQFTNIEFLVGGDDFRGTQGIIGQNLLHVSDVEYDIAHGAIRLLKPDSCPGASVVYWAKDTAIGQVELGAMDHFKLGAVGDVTVNGVRLRAEFDTGSNVSTLTLAGAKKAHLDVDGPGAVKAGYSRGIGRKAAAAWIVPVDEFDIGGEKIAHTRMRVADFSIADIDMLVGADFFLSHRVYVANSQRRVYFTYLGGPVFNLTTSGRAPAEPLPASPAASAPATDIAQTPPPAAGEPTDAEGFSRRGTAYAARRDYEHALADLTRAVELGPQEPRYYRERAELRIATRQPFLAMGDLDAALKLAPDDAPTLLQRAELRRAGRDAAGERSDLDAAAKAAPAQSDLRLTIGQLYSNASAYEDAKAQFDLWIAAHPEDSRLGSAMNGRCWARAMLNRELDAALSDCNAAIRFSPAKSPAPLDSRGMIHLRRGELDKAIVDYDAVLALQPRYAWALYGRGLAKRRGGHAAEGDADVAAAVAINPRLPELGKRVGLDG